jgi:hypothetical protein
LRYYVELNTYKSCKGRIPEKKAAKRILELAFEWRSGKSDLLGKGLVLRVEGGNSPCIWPG